MRSRISYPRKMARSCFKAVAGASRSTWILSTLFTCTFIMLIIIVNNKPISLHSHPPALMTSKIEGQWLKIHKSLGLPPMPTEITFPVPPNASTPKLYKRSYTPPTPAHLIHPTLDVNPEGRRLPRRSVPLLPSQPPMAPMKFAADALYAPSTSLEELVGILKAIAEKEESDRKPKGGKKNQGSWGGKQSRSEEKT